MNLRSAYRRHLTNPIVIRELKNMLRKKGSFGTLILIGIISTSIISSVWYSVVPNMTTHMASQVLNMLSRSIFIGISYMILFFSSLIVMSFTSSSISSERENNTFELLTVTGLTPANIIIGKLVSALGFIFFIIFATLPLVSICFILGGVAITEVLISYVAIFSTLAAVGMIGIMCSSLCKTSRKAQVLAFVIPIFLYFALPVGIEIVREAYRVRIFSEGNIFWLLNPFFNLIRVFYGNSAMPFLGSRSFLWGVSPILMILFSNVLVFLLSYSLARRFFISPEKVKTKVRKKYITDKTKIQERRKKFPYYIIDPLKKNREIGDHENPALVKEKRYTFASKLTYIIRFGYLAFVFGAILSFYMFREDVMSGESVITVLSVLLGGVFCSTLSSGSIVEEMEQETFDLLRSTLLKPWDVFRAKMRFILTTSSIIVVLFLLPAIVLSIVMVSLENSKMHLLLWVAAVDALVKTLLLTCALGLFVSTFKATRQKAQAGTVALFVIFSFTPYGVAIAGIIANWLLSGSVEEEWWFDISKFLAGFLSPLHNLGIVLEHMSDRYDYRGMLPVKYMLTSLVTFTVFILLFYRMTYRRFKKIWLYGFERFSLRKLWNKT